MWCLVAEEVLVLVLGLSSARVIIWVAQWLLGKAGCSSCYCYKCYYMLPNSSMSTISMEVDMASSAF
jgi:hypothetical protein